MKNQLKTILLLGTLSAVLVALGGALGTFWLYTFLALAVVINVGAYLFSDRLVLRSTGARLVTESQAPGLYAMVGELAARAGLPMPRVAIVPGPTPNAFATGRNPERAVVAVTEGLLHLVDGRELRGVIAHELAHVKNRDTLIATIAASAATAVSYISSTLQWSTLLGGSADEEGEGGGLLAAFVAPVAALALQSGISRSREFLADEWAARLTGDPEGLARALLRLQTHGEAMVAHGAAEPAPATAGLAIVNPFLGRGLFRLFATHPPIEARVARLRELARSRWAA